VEQNDALQIINVLEVLNIQFCCKALQSKELTRLRSELLGGNFFCFREPHYVEKQVT